MAGSTQASEAVSAGVTSQNFVVAVSQGATPTFGDPSAAYEGNLGEDTQNEEEYAEYEEAIGATPAGS